MLKVGGCVRHSLPTFGFEYINHGFYNFNFFLFQEYYRVNKFKAISFLPCIGFSDNGYYYAMYADSVEEFLRNGYFYRFVSMNTDLFNVNIVAVVEKTEESTAGVVPQQDFDSFATYQMNMQPRPDQDYSLKSNRRNSKRKVSLLNFLYNNGKKPIKVGRRVNNRLIPLDSLDE